MTGGPGPMAGDAGDQPGEHPAVPAKLVRPALEIALVVARAMSTTGSGVLPRAMVPLAGFAKLPPAALETVKRVLDEDEDFRERVADVAAEAGAPISEAARLYLYRPEGWLDSLRELLPLTGSAGGRARDARDHRGPAAATAPSAPTGAPTPQQAELAQALKRAESRLKKLEGRAQDAARGWEAEKTQRRRVEEALSKERSRSRSLEQRLADEQRQASEALAGAMERLSDLEGRLEREARSRARLQGELLARPPAHPAAAPELPAERPPAAAPELPTEPPPAQPAGPPALPAELPAVLRQVAEAASHLAGELVRAASLVQPPGAAPASAVPAGAVPGGGGPAGAVPGGGGPTGVTVPGKIGHERVPSEQRAAASQARHHRQSARRRPVELPPGLMDDTPGAAWHLVTTKGVVVVVDGYNVSIRCWPDLDLPEQRRRLIDALAGLSMRSGARVQVIFDGAEGMERPLRSLSPLRSAVRVRFSPPEVEADDVILALLDELPAEVPVVVVTSDRRVEEGARSRGANAVSSSQLLMMLGLGA
ncbi:MAG: NYN domain-containing protein [Acidimicrobiales bacterium]